MSIKLVSGDRDEPVRKLAAMLDVPCLGGASPRQKIEQIAEMSAEGHRILMVGDGLNDTPALAAAHVSMAPASAADVGRNAADLVFLRDSLLVRSVCNHDRKKRLPARPAESGAGDRI